jgi:AmmeMemoRadiSam system protein A
MARRAARAAGPHAQREEFVVNARDLEPELILAIARGAVAEHFGATPMQVPARPWLAEPAATFVSIWHVAPSGHLARGEQLHGCIGSVEPRRSLVDDLRHNASLAAFQDPRTRALRADEFDLVRFSVAILGPHTPLSFTSQAEARASLRPRVDGVILSWHGHRGLFLPKVWESLPDPTAFLDQLKRKAGLPADFWHPDIELERFEVLEFEEPCERAAKVAQGWRH